MKSVADAGYGSEENYEFMEDNNIQAFVKYNYFHKEQTKSFKNDAFLVQNLYYNETEDYYVCPMGQHMKKVDDSTRESASGYKSHLSVYQSINCNGCPLRCLCHSAKGNRRIEVNHNLNRHKEKVRENLTSEEGRMHRSRRSVEPESVFGQTKSNKKYSRFRHFDKDEPEKAMMDFAIVAIAFNMLKLYRKSKKWGQNPSRSQKTQAFLWFFIVFLPKTDKTERLEFFNDENRALAA